MDGKSFFSAFMPFPLDNTSLSVRAGSTSITKTSYTISVDFVVVAAGHLTPWS
ncbi:hypothetical protein PEDI_12900 [Persicobacter diffluens]|uniref:Uncharacterized protein n=1 Tax=Persicobacter diffluens TaxID=981 RepID=A0AAN4VXG1_9BACT|nr:hypothetical protein PEDI_12900 [Persicobacter diffluens]